ncbi:hypothetical protein Anapl_12485 [Anas platyrhynchos]|uniref:Uncharacterized protein n=1 Tax=Anas platyrhynchos TaxID=8839 RepID=R0M4J5_ANAPL|nr:hypothetical protein Anapl_12485 [Anas platyrhynchos]
MGALSLNGHTASWLQLLLPHTEAVHFDLLFRHSPWKKWLQLQGVQHKQPTLNQNPPRQDPDGRKTWGARSKKQVVMVRMSWDAEARSQLGMQSSNNCRYHHLSSCLQCQVGRFCRPQKRAKEIVCKLPSSQLSDGGRSEKIKHPNFHKLGSVGKGQLKNLCRGEESLVPWQLNYEVSERKQIKPVTSWKEGRVQQSRAPEHQTEHPALRPPRDAAGGASPRLLIKNYR